MFSQTLLQLSPVDHQFIVQTLGRTAHERAALQRLMSDPATVGELLHDKRLFEKSVSAPPLFLAISPLLFFYLLVYRALVEKGLGDDDLAGYIAAMCVEFRYSEALWQAPGVSEGKMVYFVDLLELMGSLDREQQYHLRKHIGNAALFLTGFFPDFLFQRYKRKGAPPLEYYEKIGRAQYGTAALASTAYDEQSVAILNTLSERFVEIRMAINLYTDLYLHLSNRKLSLEKLERQSATLDEETLRRALDS